MAGFISLWRGREFERVIHDEVAARLDNAGRAGAAEARRLVPVDTGQTRDSIGYTVNRSTLTLQIYADTRWAIFIELGTRYQPPRPFLRPALQVAGKAFGNGVNLELGLANAPSKYAAGYQRQTGSHVTVGRKGLFGLGKRKAAVKIGHGRFR